MAPKIAYFDCASGISGDMIVASFLDAGLKLSVLEKELAKLKLSGYRLRAVKTKRSDIAATQFECRIRKSPARQTTTNTLGGILHRIEKSALRPRVKDNARKVFLKLGAAEAKVHKTKLEEVHFHEAGNTDSIVDIVGACVAIDMLGIDTIYASAVSIAQPAPATLQLLKGIPTLVKNMYHEIATPTGVATVAALSKAFGTTPVVEPGAIGFGAGKEDFAVQPNVLKVMIGEPLTAYKEDEVTIIEANIDDLNPQVFEYLYSRLFEAGALDVFVTPVQMKKSRPGFTLTVLAEHDLLDAIAQTIFAETTTIGFRCYQARRLKLDRAPVKIHTKYGQIRGKKSWGPRGIEMISPEYDDCVKIAKKRHIPLKKVYEEARSKGAL